MTEEREHYITFAVSYMDEDAAERSLDELERLLETVRREKGRIPFYVSVSRENEVAIRLFRGVGFEDTQKSWGEETLMRIDL